MVVACFMFKQRRVEDMCLYGTLKYVNVINPNQNKNNVVVDACIANEIQELNDNGVITLGCCCGHGMAGEITEWENGFGKWKGQYNPPNTLINKDSIELAKILGYKPFPYYYADGDHNDVWQINLNTGCVTQDDCKVWHKINNIEFKTNLGLIDGSV
jgi:hypothetical protein